MDTHLIYLFLFLSAFASGALVVVFKPHLGIPLKLLLSFSGAYLLALCVLHLIPELYENQQSKIGLYILVGFIFQLLLEQFSKGIEHGHFHAHASNEKQLFPFSIFISLWLHSFIEGMALIDPNHNHEHNNTPLLMGIIIHKIPIAIVLVTLLIARLKSKSLITTFILIFAISAPLGLYLAQKFDTLFLNDISILMALAVGVFLHISTTILFESTENHKFNTKKFGIIILGFLLAILTL